MKSKVYHNIEPLHVEVELNTEGLDNRAAKLILITYVDEVMNRVPAQLKSFKRKRSGNGYEQIIADIDVLKNIKSRDFYGDEAFEDEDVDFFEKEVL